MTVAPSRARPWAPMPVELKPDCFALTWRKPWLRDGAAFELGTSSRMPTWEDRISSTEASVLVLWTLAQATREALAEWLAKEVA